MHSEPRNAQNTSFRLFKPVLVGCSSWGAAWAATSTTAKSGSFPSGDGV